MRTKVIVASTKIEVEVFSESYIEDGWIPVDAPWYTTDQLTAQETWYLRLKKEDE